MSEEIAIKVQGLSKAFVQNSGNTFWALKDVSFEVRKGEVLGIIGVNGSGKSTLLNILSEIIRPTNGVVTIDGNYSSILDVGSGFHPDLTGRENVYFKGSLLGMSQKEIDERFEDIVSFSELGKFIDEPLKNYSNGMFLRLAFSISISLSYEIVLLDEVLSVGDINFREKCNRIIKQELKLGKTIILVSHSLDEIRMLTDRCILLENGKLLIEDLTENVIEKYRMRNEALAGGNNSMKNEAIEILECTVHELISDKPVFDLKRNESFEIKIKLRKKNGSAPLELMMTLVNNVDVLVMSDSMTFRMDYEYLNTEDGTYVYTVKIPGNILNNDYYRIMCMCSTKLDVILEPTFVGKFRILPEDWETKFSWSGQQAVTRPKLNWNLNKSPK